MPTPNEKTAELKNRFLHETKNYIAIALYIAMVLYGLKIYKKMILVEYDISYYHLGYGLFESMILAKIILLGDFLRLGERFAGKQLIIKIIYKAFAMSILALFFSILEYTIEGFFHGPGATGVIQGVMLKDGPEMLAHATIMFINFIPLFTIWEIGRTMGDNRLFKLLFKSRPGIFINGR